MGILYDIKKNAIIMGLDDHFTILYKEENLIGFEDMFNMTNYWKNYDKYAVGAVELTFFEKLERNIIYPLTTIKSFKSENVDGKDCYAITIKEPHTVNEIVYYIEKETNLPVKEKYISNEENSTDGEMFFEYSFEEITKEKIGYPDMSNAYVSFQ